MSSNKRPLNDSLDKFSVSEIDEETRRDINFGQYYPSQVIHEIDRNEDGKSNGYIITNENTGEGVAFYVHDAFAVNFDGDGTDFHNLETDYIALSEIHKKDPDKQVALDILGIDELVIKNSKYVEVKENFIDVGVRRKEEASRELLEKISPEKMAGIISNAQKNEYESRQSLSDKMEFDRRAGIASMIRMLSVVDAETSELDWQNDVAVKAAYATEDVVVKDFNLVDADKVRIDLNRNVPKSKGYHELNDPANKYLISDNKKNEPDDEMLKTLIKDNDEVLSSYKIKIKGVDHGFKVATVKKAANDGEKPELQLVGLQFDGIEIIDTNEEVFDYLGLSDSKAVTGTWYGKAGDDYYDNKENASEEMRLDEVNENRFVQLANPGNIQKSIARKQVEEVLVKRSAQEHGVDINDQKALNTFKESVFKPEQQARKDEIAKKNIEESLYGISLKDDERKLIESMSPRDLMRDIDILKGRESEPKEPGAPIQDKLNPVFKIIETEKALREGLNNLEPFKHLLPYEKQKVRPVLKVQESEDKEKTPELAKNLSKKQRDELYNIAFSRFDDVNPVDPYYEVHYAAKKYADAAWGVTSDTPLLEGRPKGIDSIELSEKEALKILNKESDLYDLLRYKQDTYQNLLDKGGELSKEASVLKQKIELADAKANLERGIIFVQANRSREDAKKYSELIDKKKLNIDKQVAYLDTKEPTKEEKLAYESLKESGKDLDDRLRGFDDPVRTYDIGATQHAESEKHNAEYQEHMRVYMGDYDATSTSLKYERDYDLRLARQNMGKLEHEFDIPSDSKDLVLNKQGKAFNEYESLKYRHEKTREKINANYHVEEAVHNEIQIVQFMADNERAVRFLEATEGVERAQEYIDSVNDVYKNAEECHVLNLAELPSNQYTDKDREAARKYKEARTKRNEIIAPLIKYDEAKKNRDVMTVISTVNNVRNNIAHKALINQNLETLERDVVTTPDERQVSEATPLDAIRNNVTISDNLTSTEAKFLESWLDKKMEEKARVQASIRMDRPAYQAEMSLDDEIQVENHRKPSSRRP